MKNIFDVLKKKEDELKALQVEVDALKIAARLLADDDKAAVSPEPAPAPKPQAVARAASAPVHAVPAAVGGYSAAWGNAPRQFP